MGCNVSQGDIKAEHKKATRLERILQSNSELKQLQHKLHNHKLYDAVKGERNIKIFMESHIFAVWDFMLLLKQLQRKLTCVDKIWLPPQSNTTARFINQIVVGEETDIHPEKKYGSHFELYLDAMKQIGADTSVIEQFIQSLRNGGTVEEGLSNKRIPEHARKFVLNTYNSIQKPTPFVASQFFFGRQDPIPQMFHKFVSSISQGNAKCKYLKYYLERHIEVDGDEHGPLAEKLLEELADREDPRFEMIIAGAVNAVDARIKFWDGIYKSIS